MSTSAHRDSLPEHPDPDMSEYRPVSGWGLAAFLIGMVSAAALAHPLLWSIPLAGVVVSLIALRRIERSEVKLLGRSAALVGLAFSIIYGVAAPARLLSHDHWLAARAERLADEFLEAIRSQQSDRAFAMTLQSVEKSSPRHPAPAGDKADSEPKSQQEFFLGQPPVSTLLAIGAKARVERIRTDVSARDGGRQSVGVLFELHYPDEQGLRPLQFFIVVEQVFDAENAERWWIMSVSAAQQQLSSK